MAGTYNVLQDFGASPTADDIGRSCYWVIVIVTLDSPLSFDRSKMKSASTDITAGANLRGEPLIITDDCVQIQVNGSKRTHTKQMSAVLKGSDRNYLLDVLPGDYCFAWLLNYQEDYEILLKKIAAKEACNAFDSGLKFVGRVSGVRKSVSVDRNGGAKMAAYTLQCTGFQELDTQIFLDPNLMTEDQVSGQLELWLARIGHDASAIFGEPIKEGGVKANNCNVIVPTLIDLFVGKGPKTKTRKEANIPLQGRGAEVSTVPSFNNEAPYSLLVPALVGAYLGVKRGEASKPAKIISYADILELIQGVQKYPTGIADSYKAFLPEGKQKGNRRTCTDQLLGTFLPLMPAFCNKPLFQVLQQYSNGAINELYTAIKPNENGALMPTLVFRQIPFTTSAFTPDPTLKASNSHDGGAMPFTKFLDVPRWIVPDVMVYNVDLGRSDDTRFNFVHVYGQASLLADNVPLQTQILENPPIMDSIDIMRNGLRAYMTTVDSWISDQVGKVPGQWMALIADFLIGSQYTLNGSLTCAGIQSPICEGDNLEFDRVVYHIEAVNHAASIDGNGNKTWSTTLQLTNGMRALEPGDDVTKFPIYPGFLPQDNERLNPGLSLEGRRTTGGEKIPKDSAEQESTSDPEDTASRLADDKEDRREHSRSAGRMIDAINKRDRG